jgi:hypothetical protein
MQKNVALQLIILVVLLNNYKIEYVKAMEQSDYSKEYTVIYFIKLFNT